LRGDKSGTLSEFWRMTAGFRGFRSPPLGDGHGRQSNAGPPGLWSGVGTGEVLGILRVSGDGKGGRRPI